MGNNYLLLLVVLALALLICIIAMVISVIVNIRQEKAFETYKGIVEKRLNAIDETENCMIETLEIYFKFFSNVVPEMKKLREESEKVLAVANDKAEHARRTMQCARKLSAEEPFKFEEPEEDPDEPRS